MRHSKDRGALVPVIAIAGLVVSFALAIFAMVSLVH